MQFAIFMTITWSAFALTNFEKRIQNDKKNDQILIARCEAKCWNQLSEQNKVSKLLFIYSLSELLYSNQRVTFKISIIFQSI